MNNLQKADTALADDVHDDGVPNPVYHHVQLKTTRLDALIEWYGLVVGMRPNFRTDQVVFITNDDANHRIALLATPELSDDPDKVSHTGMHHTAFEFATLEHLLTRYRTLAQTGILPHACFDHGPTISFYYLDPDENSVELQADNFSDWALSSEFLRTSSAFRENPLGVHLDPDRLCEASEQGLSAAEIHERAYRGEYPAGGPIDYRAAGM